MPVPTLDRFTEAVLRYLAAHPEGAETRDAVEGVAASLGLTRADREETVPAGTLPLYRNRTLWAHHLLKRAGYSTSPKRGIWRLSPRGFVFAATHEAPLTKEALHELRRSRSCFLTAPAGTSVDVLREVLSDRDVTTLAPEILRPGASWREQLQEVLERVDFVVGVLPATFASTSVLFDLGHASALGKRIVLFVEPGSERLPATMADLLTIKTELNNRDALGFAIDQLISAPRAPKQRAPLRAEASRALGPRVDEFIRRLSHLERESDFEALLYEVLRASAVDAIAQPRIKGTRPDFAMWSDALASYVGNPLIIEVKRSIAGQRAAEAIRQVQKYVLDAGASWGVLIYAEGASPSGALLKSTPLVLALRFSDLLERLRQQSFVDIIRTLRNERVHGTGQLMGAISQKRVTTFLRKAQTARTTKAQGDAFENLLCYVFEQVPGIVVSRRNQRNNADTEEIDIAFWNDRSPKGFAFLPHIILAECKHWSKPVGSEQVAWFVQKLRHRGLEYGLMLAHKGITGDTNSLRDAYSIVSDAQMDGIRMVVITTVELRALTSSGDLIVLLKEKLCDLAVKGGTL